MKYVQNLQRQETRPEKKWNKWFTCYKANFRLLTKHFMIHGENVKIDNYLCK